MEAIYNIIIILIIAVIIAFVVGMIKPKLFSKFLGTKANRKFIAIYSIGLFFGLAILSGITEPASVKQARLDKENQAKIAKEVQNNQQPAQQQKPEEVKVEEVQTNPNQYWHEVTRVVDGDTVKVKVDGKEESIRIIGIDSPESTTSTECFGAEASAKAKEFLEGKWVQLEKDDSQSERDKYSRLLRYVWFDNGTDFGRRMIEEGYAHEYTYNVPYNKQAQYKTTYEEAKNTKRGLWSADTCNGQDQKPSPEPAQTYTAPAPTPEPAPSAPVQSINCDPNYSGGCVPNVSNDLDCGDISFSVRVIGTDKHRFDRDGDGYGCESN
jgi:endonuclease YncB( thermonuclease family)